MKLVVVLAVIVALFAAGIVKVEFRWWTSSGASNIPAAKDVNRLTAATARTRLDASSQNLYAMLNGVNVNTASGMAVLLHRVPGVAWRMAQESETARRRLRNVEADTETGRRFRAVLDRGLLAQRLMYDDLVAGLRHPQTARSAFRRWVARYNRLQGWYARQLNDVIRVTAVEDRAAVMAALAPS